MEAELNSTLVLDYHLKSILNYYLHGGVEEHYDGSFTIFGTIEALTDELFKILNRKVHHVFQCC